MAHFVTGIQPALLESVHRTSHQGHVTPAHQGHYPAAHQGHHPPSHQHSKPKPPGSIELHSVHHVAEIKKLL
ncbi:UNVERIFIED_CONTAM: hypothetical protein PYX00_002432 [Menopon gallinae]|uniref:Uncharacterized protein n=1 Tax=Menopon gallinae TaxID=328185 RepID=A0AAW2IH04_9NEOP